MIHTRLAWQTDEDVRMAEERARIEAARLQEIERRKKAREGRVMLVLFSLLMMGLGFGVMTFILRVTR